MNKTLIAKAEISIQAPTARVWEALIKPELIKQYFFGADVITDWKMGSPILYKGIYEGKPYEDKGKVVRIEPGKLLVATHWSPLSGLPDRPEYYHQIHYELAVENGGTHLTISQDNNATQAEQEQNAANWQMVLVSLKKLLEG
jgi:uncharacterized protein YndB with AHSA1/START domain